MATIISACISAGVTLVVCLIQQEKTRSLMEYKLDELTKRVDKHNNTIERTYHLEEQMALQEEKMKVANHRISDLEENDLKEIAIFKDIVMSYLKMERIAQHEAE